MSGKQFLAVLLVAAVAAFAGGLFAVRFFPPNATEKSVSAQEYHLLDLAGVQRASFEVSISDEPSLILRDREGKQRAVLSFTESGEALWSRNASATDTLHLLAHDDKQRFMDSE